MAVVNNNIKLWNNSGDKNMDIEQQVTWSKKDLLSLYDLTADEINIILDTATEFKKVSQRNVKKVPALRGKTVVNFFVEPSTRTRMSFELAEQRLSADIINISASTVA